MRQLAVRGRFGRRVLLTVLLVLATAAVLVGVPDRGPSQGGPIGTTVAAQARRSSILLAAVGDTNPEGQSRRSSRTGRVAASIRAAHPRAVLHLGDWQYQYGSCRALVHSFARTGWGALLPRVIGTAGPTHDWRSRSDTRNYRRHMAGRCPGQTSGKSLSSAAWNRTRGGGDVGPETSHYVDLGAWRVISVSSGLWRYDPAAARRTTEWLGRALAKGRAAGDHLIVMWHEPYWTSVTEGHRPATATRPWVRLLDKYNVRIVLNGHQHGYERFYPQTATGTRNSATGTQAFTVGTGGIGFYDFETRARNSAVRQASAYGWLALRLWPSGHYAWDFHRTGGGSFTDRGHR
jgi:hypothetical protein